MRRSWYIGHNSLNRPPLRIAQQYQLHRSKILSVRINLVTDNATSTFSVQQFPRWQCGSIFIRLAIPRKFELTAVQAYPRSMILVPIESAYATSY